MYKRQDTGVRTFQTIYSSDGLAGKLGDEIVDKKLIPIAKRIDHYQSVISKVDKSQTRRNLKKRCALLRTKIKNITSDLHWKVADFLCQNFETIIIPKFEVQEITHRSKSINSTTTKKMLSLSHYKFRQRLVHKANMYNRNVLITGEAFTSKTCGHCGILNNDLGSKKVFDCKKCDVKLDRDINGARNIMIRLCTLLQGQDTDSLK